jgi:hypothetical protein
LNKGQKSTITKSGAKKSTITHKNQRLVPTLNNKKIRQSIVRFAGLSRYILKTALLLRFFSKTITRALYQNTSYTMAGAEGLEPSARGFGATEQTFAKCCFAQCLSHS